MSEYRHHLVDTGKLLQALMYMDSAEQLSMHWLVVLVYYFRAAALMCELVQPTMVALNCLDQQT